MSTKPLTSKRIYSYDIIRIIAAIGVVMAHSVSVLVTDAPYGSLDFTYGNFFDTMGRASIALFLMLSGALLLNEDKKIPTKKLYTSALRLVLIGLIWSTIYALVIKIIIPSCKGEEVDFEVFFNTVLKGHFHLWYIFMLAGLYLITPILRFVIKRKNINYILFFLAILFLVHFVPFFVNEIVNLFAEKQDIINNLFKKLEFEYGNEYLFYYLTGWVVTNFRLTDHQKKVLYCAGIIGFAVTFFGIQFTLSEENRECVFYNNRMINIAAYGISAFVFLNERFKNFEPKKSKKLMLNLSSLTFGVYLIHCFAHIIIRNFTEDLSSGILRSLIDFVFAIVTSFIAIYGISKVPYLKKIIST